MLVVCFLFAISSCQSDIKPFTSGEQQLNAYSSLENLLSKNALHLNSLDEWKWADGELAFLRVLVNSPDSAGLSNKLFIDASGRISSSQDAIEKYWREHYQRFGRQHPDLVKRLIDLPSQQRVPIGIWFDSESISDQQVQETLQSLDAKSSVVSNMPLARANLTNSEIRSLAWLSWVNSIEFDGFDPIPMGKSSGKGVSDYTASDETFNKEGFYGKGINVGVLDWISGGCAMESGHEAFEFAHINYSRPLVPCQILQDGSGRHCETHSDCFDNHEQCHNGRCSKSSCESIECNPGLSGWLDTNSFQICIPQSNTNVVDETSGSYCVPVGGGATHASEVSSRISEGVRGEKLHAASANLWMINDVKVEGDWYPWIKAFPNAIQYMVENNTHIINESWMNGNEGFTVTDHTRDWFAREKRVLFTKAAGQTDTCEMAKERSAGCDSLNSLCVSTTSAGSGYNKTYDDFSDDGIGCAQYWINPPSPISEGFKDAERPDLVTEGTFGRIMTSLTSDGWNTDKWGTSYAAPAVAGLAALMAEYCGYGNNILPMRMRARMRAAAWSPQHIEVTGNRDPNSPFYPRWNDGLDAHIGAGIIEASKLKRFCDPSGNSNEAGTPVDGSFDGTGWQPLEVTPWDWVYKAQSDESSVRRDKNTLSHLLVENKGGMDVVPLYAIKGVKKGSRIRFNYSYETCPDSKPDSESYKDYSAPAVDYDLAICSSDQTWCVTSESFDDTNEGFDVDIPRDFENVTVLLFKPQGSKGCNNRPDPGFWAAYLWL